VTGAAKADNEKERNNGNGNDVGNGHVELKNTQFSCIGEVCAVDNSLLMGDPNYPRFIATGSTSLVGTSHLFCSTFLLISHVEGDTAFSAKADPRCHIAAVFSVRQCF